MDTAYCGKSCDDCSRKQQLNCPGCKAAAQTDCPIARCCRSSRREACESCATAERCAALASAGQIPMSRLNSQEPLRQSGSNAKILTVLFGCLFGFQLASLLTDAVAVILKNLSFLLMLLFARVQLLVALACLLGTLIVIWMLRRWDPRCQTIILCNLATIGLYAAGQALGAWLGLLMQAAAALCGLYALRQQLAAYASISAGADTLLTHKWNLLWKLTLGALCLTAVHVLVSLLLPFAGRYLETAIAVYQYLLKLFQLFYLFETCAAFRKLSKS